MANKNIGFQVGDKIQVPNNLYYTQKTFKTNWNIYKNEYLKRINKIMEIKSINLSIWVNKKIIWFEDTEQISNTPVTGFLFWDANDFICPKKKINNKKLLGIS